jgi:hypothetical protein
MRVIITWRPAVKGGLADKTMWLCRNAFVRDGFLFILSGTGSTKSERMIHGSKFHDVEILKSDDLVEPDVPAKPTTTYARCPNCGSEDPDTRLFGCDNPGGWHAPLPGGREPDGDPFTEMENVLAGWVQGSKENHEALDHRGEPTDRQCWDWHHTSDVRRMIQAARREWKPGQ